LHKLVQSEIANEPQPVFLGAFVSHRPKCFQNNQKKLSHFSQNAENIG